MKILLCFPFYKDCPIYTKILEQVKLYKGEHVFILKKAKGTIVHDSRNLLISETLRIGNDWKLPEFDVAVLIDSDTDPTIEDIIYIAEYSNSKQCVIGLPMVLRGDEKKYNAGFLLENGFKHLPIETTGLMEVHGQSNGCKAIPRVVFETLKPYWFFPIQHTYKDGSIESLVEDWAFDFKARKAGFRVLCDFDRPVNHKTGEKMELAKSQRASQSMLNNISGYIGQLIDLIEKLQGENNTLKSEIESLKGVSTEAVGGSRAKGKPPK